MNGNPIKQEKLFTQNNTKFIHKGMKCPHCNIEHPEGTKFCPETGKKMPSIVGCTNKDCPNYGRNDLPTHYKFCPECGALLLSLHEKNISREIVRRQEDVKKCPYDDIEFFRDGMAVVRKNGKYGYIDKNGKEVIECKYDFAEHFREELALVKDGNYMFIDKRGDVIFKLDDSFEFYGLNNGFSEGLCKVCRFENRIIDSSDEDDDSVKIGFVDRTGKLVIDCQFDHASDFHNGRALVWDDGVEDDYEHESVNFRFIDKEGKEVTGSFDSATEFRDGYAAIQIETIPQRHGNYKTRIIDVNGKNVYKLDMHDPLRRNLFSESQTNYGLHDKIFRYSYREWIDLETGKKEACSHNDFCMSKYGFFDGLVAVQDRQGKWGFMNVDGDVMINCQFDNEYAPAFSEGLACVKQNGLWGYIDKTGEVVIPYQYIEASSFGNDRAIVRKDNMLMVIDNKGNRIV